MSQTKDDGKVRTFTTGATRNTAQDKIDPEAFFDPLVVAEFSAYMHRHRLQADGTLRAGDNWQKGFPRAQIMKSLWRHMLDLWLMHRGCAPISEDHLRLMLKEGTKTAHREILCALYFNVAAMLREVMMERSVPE